MFSKLLVNYVPSRDHLVGVATEVANDWLRVKATRGPQPSSAPVEHITWKLKGLEHTELTKNTPEEESINQTRTKEVEYLP